MERATCVDGCTDVPAGSIAHAQCAAKRLEYRTTAEGQRQSDRTALCTPFRVQPSLIALNPTDRTEGPATAISTLHVSVYRIQLTGIQLFHVFGVNAVMFRLDRGPSPSALV